MQMGDRFDSSKMILEGVRHLVPYLGVSYANDPPPKGEYNGVRAHT